MPAFGLPLSATETLAEEVFHFFKNPRGSGLVIDRHGLRQLSHQVALGAAHLLRNLHDHFDDKVALALVVQVGNAAPSDAQFLAALRALGNLEADRAVDAGNVNLRAQGGLREADGNDAVEVVADALEEVVRADGENDVKIALGTAGAAGIALARVADARALFNAASGTLTLSLNSAEARPSPRQTVQGSEMTVAGATAGDAGAGHGEESLLVADLSAAMTVAAGCRSAAGGAADTFTGGAGVEAAEVDFGFGAENGILEIDGQVVAEIVAALHA